MGHNTKYRIVSGIMYVALYAREQTKTFTSVNKRLFQIITPDREVLKRRTVMVGSADKYIDVLPLNLIVDDNPPKAVYGIT